MVGKANRENWRGIHLVFFPRGPKTNQRSQDRSLAREEGLRLGVHFSLMLFLKNAPLAWAALSENEEGPQAEAMVQLFWYLLRPHASCLTTGGDQP